MAHALIEAWRVQEFSSPPFKFHGDEIRGSQYVTINSHEDLVKHDNYAVSDSKFHLGLLPVPFIGDLAKADIFIGLINPGLDVTHDYYVEGTRLDY